MSSLNMSSLKELVVYQHIKLLALEDKDLDQSLRRIQLRYYHPCVDNMMKLFNHGPEEEKLNLKKLSQQLDDSIKEEVLEVCKYLSGRDAEPSLDDILSEIEKFKVECQILDSIDRDIANVKESILKVSRKYFGHVEKNTKEFKLGFKLNYDYATCNLLCAKAQALCLKKRLEETEEAVHKYGKKDIVDSIKRKRNDLETENQSLMSELEEKKQLLEKFEALDPTLLKEYTTLKEDLSCRQWAYRMVDRSSNCSTGSIGDQSV